MVVSIDQVVSDFIQQEMQNMDLDDMICETVRMSFEVDDIEDHGSSIEEIQQTLFDIQDKFDPQNVINLENSVKNLVDNSDELDVCIKHLLVRIKDLEDRLNDYEEIREMAWQSANKSFIQKLMFWR